MRAVVRKPPSWEAVLSRLSRPRAISVSRIATSSSVCQPRLIDSPGTMPADRPPEKAWPPDMAIACPAVTPSPWERPACSERATERPSDHPSETASPHDSESLTPLATLCMRLTVSVLPRLPLTESALPWVFAQPEVSAPPRVSAVPVVSAHPRVSAPPVVSALPEVVVVVVELEPPADAVWLEPVLALEPVLSAELCEAELADDTPADMLLEDPLLSADPVEADVPLVAVWLALAPVVSDEPLVQP